MQDREIPETSKKRKCEGTTNPSDDQTCVRLLSCRVPLPHQLLLPSNILSFSSSRCLCQVSRTETCYIRHYKRANGTTPNESASGRVDLDQLQPEEMNAYLPGD